MAAKKTGSERIEAALRELARMHVDVPWVLEQLVLDERKLVEGGGNAASHGKRPFIPRVEAVLRSFRRDLYILFLESDRTARDVADSLPPRGIRRLLGAPVDADVALVRARLAKQIGEKRAVVEKYRLRRRGMSLRRAVRHIADAWAESHVDWAAGHSAEGPA